MSQDVLAPGRLRVGINPQDNVDVAERTVTESAGRGEKYFELYVASAIGPSVAMMKARGTATAPGNVIQDDGLGAYYFKSYSNGWLNSASLEAEVDAAVVAGQRPASRMLFKTNANNAAPRLVGYFSNEGYLGLGTAFNPAIAATRASAPLHVAASGAGADLPVQFDAYEAGNSAILYFRRARGTFAAPTNVSKDDVLGKHLASAYSNGFLTTAEVHFSVDAAVVAGQRPASRITFLTNANNAAARRIGYMSSEGYLGWGTAFDPTTTATRATAPLHVVGSGAGADLVSRFEAYEAGNAVVLNMTRARGTFAAPTNVASADIIGSLRAAAYSGQIFDTAEIRYVVDDAVVNNQRPASRMSFWTNLANTAPRLTGYISREGYLGWGTAFAPDTAATRAAYPIHVVASGSAAELYCTLENYDATNNATYRMGRARGTFAAPTTIVTGDVIGEIEFFAYTNQWHHCAEVTSSAEGTIVAGTTPDSNLQFSTTTGGALGVRGTFFSTGVLALGAGATQTLTTANNNGLGFLWIADTTTTNLASLHYAAANASAGALFFRKSRGNLSAPATINTGDNILYIGAQAYTNTWHTSLAGMSVVAESTITAGQAPATRIEFFTNAKNAAIVTYMQILSGGTVFVGTGTPETSRVLHVRGSSTVSLLKVQNDVGGANGNGVNITAGDNSTTGSDFISFNRPDNTQIGHVTQNAASTVQYATSSDGRLKQDVQDMDSGLALVNAMRPRSFTYIGDSVKQRLRGFIAQEMAQVLPEMVSQTNGQPCACDLKNGGKHVDTCVFAKPWSIDYGRLTPVLAKAIQELSAQVVAIATKVGVSL